jgi:hypothetical protein
MPTFHNHASCYPLTSRDAFAIPKHFRIVSHRAFLPLVGFLCYQECQFLHEGNDCFCLSAGKCYQASLCVSHVELWPSEESARISIGTYQAYFIDRASAEEKLD